MLFGAMCALAARIYTLEHDAPFENRMAEAKYTTEFLSRTYFNRARFSHIKSNFLPRVSSVQALLLMAQREVRWALSAALTN